MLRNMLKNIYKNKFFLWISWIILTILLIVFIKNTLNNITQNWDQIIFTYPEWKIDFAWEELPDLDENYFIKERFDKEFLNVSYNLYQFFLYVKRLPIYLPYIEEKLDEYNIPEDFKYLPIAESALRNDVVSSVWAAWIWQFMPWTAKEYWLIVNDNIDERYNFEKATLAAAKYLEYLHTLFWDWTLVAASYNRWQNWIKSALEDQKVNNYYDLYLNEETSRYVFRILAIKYVIKDYYNKKSYIDKIIWWVYKNPETKVVKLWKVSDLKSWAKDNWQNYQTIKILNPWILKDSLPEWDWEVKILK